MVSKAGRGREARLICSDCGLRLNPVVAPRPRQRRNHLGTALLLVVFALTAAGLMLISEHLNPSLMEEEGINLNQERQPKQDESKRWIVVPGRPVN